MARTLSLEEQEVAINFTRTDDYATCYCSDSTFITVMDKKVKANPEEFSVIDEDIYGKTYKFPKKYVSIRTKTKVLTEEQKAAASSRLKKRWSDK